MEKNILKCENKRIKEFIENSETSSEITKKTIFSALKITKSQYCYISCFNKESNRTTILAASQNQIENQNAEFLTFTFNGFISLWKWIIKNLVEMKKKRNNDTINQHNKTTILTQQKPVPVDRFLTLPVVFKDKLYGQIAIASLNKHYDNEDILILQKIASQLSLELYVIDISRKGI